MHSVTKLIFWTGYVITLCLLTTYIKNVSHNFCSSYNWLPVFVSCISSVPLLFCPYPFTPLWFVSYTLFHSFYCSCCCFQCLLVVKLLNWGIQNSPEGTYFYYGIIMFVSITSQITFIIIDNLFFLLHYCFLKIDPIYSWNCLTTCFFFSDGAFTAQPDVS